MMQLHEYRSAPALGVPPTGRQTWRGVLAALEKIAHLNGDQVGAAKAGEPERFAAAADALGETQIELERATAAAGVAKCAEVHR
jgi:hypothetical protein